MSRGSVGRRGLSENITLESKLSDEEENLEDESTPVEQCPFIGVDGYGETSRCVLPAGHTGPGHIGRNL